jgi:UDP-N-acetylmuramoyl-tripeptide--D-alanyl-D-alanine ligase
MNSLAVVAALDVIGCDVARVSRALAGVASAQGRGARVSLAAEGREILLLDESYNANPASMAAALENLSNVDPAGRRIAVIGDMLELAPTDSPHIAIGYHEDLLPGLARIDLVLCCGPNMRHLYDALPPDKRAAWAPTSIDLVAHVLATLRPGDAVMVKGSLGSRMAPIVEAIKKRFAPPGAGG